MESLGEKLRSVREEKDLSFDQVSRETNIALRYLEALEREDFSVFPGEAYVIGFLRNYGAYLDLDVQELLNLYRALKVQEQPVPELLLKTPAKFPKALIAVVVVVVIFGALGGVFLLVSRDTKPPAAPSPRSPVEHVMNTDSFERRFYPGDSLLVPVGTAQYKLELLNLGEAVTIHTPSRPQPLILDLSQEVQEDLNNDGAADLRITVADFAKNDADMGVLLRFNLNAASDAVAIAEDAPANTPAEPVNTAVVAGATVIFSSPTPYPFTLQANFQGYCMLRWEILAERDRRGRNERYFQPSDDWSNQANNGIRLWMSNAQAAKFQVSGGGKTVPIELGGAGEVVVADIRWVRDDDNRYRLVLVRLET